MDARQVKQYLETLRIELAEASSEDERFEIENEIEFLLEMADEL